MSAMTGPIALKMTDQKGKFTMVKEMKVKNRLECIKAMHTLMLNLNDEEPYYNRWIYIVPDGADDSDFEYIAEDEETFEMAVNCFCSVFKNIHFHGLHIADQVYPKRGE